MNYFAVSYLIYKGLLWPSDDHQRTAVELVLFVSVPILLTAFDVYTIICLHSLYKKFDGEKFSIVNVSYLQSSEEKINGNIA
jgi:hypothetical protein